MYQHYKNKKNNHTAKSQTRQVFCNITRHEKTLCNRQLLYKRTAENNWNKSQVLKIAKFAVRCRVVINSQQEKSKHWHFSFQQKTYGPGRCRVSSNRMHVNNSISNKQIQYDAVFFFYCQNNHNRSAELLTARSRISEWNLLQSKKKRSAEYIKHLL